MTRSRKKLLYLAFSDPDLQVTGATVRMGAFVKYLAAQYDVTLINMEGSGHPVAPDIVSRQRDADNEFGVVRRIRIAFSQKGYFLFSPTFYRAAYRCLQQGAFDYILADYGLAAVHGVPLARRFGVPLIYSSHNVEYRMYWEQSKRDLRRGLLAPYVHWAERAACRAAALVVAISERDRQVYAKWLPNTRLEVIPQGFDPAHHHPYYEPPPVSPPVLLFVGNFRNEYNLQAARSIVHEIKPHLLRAYPDAVLQLIGADPPPDLLAPQVECLGFIEDLTPYWQRANLLIAPISNGVGMSTKIIFGLAYGKTVLTTPEGLGAIPPHYRQLVVAPRDTFADRMVTLLRAAPTVHAQDFSSLCHDFGWPSLMARLCRRIEQIGLADQPVVGPLATERCRHLAR